MARHPLYEWTPQEAQIIKSAWQTELGRLALQLIVERLGSVDALSFDPDSERQSAFNDGRRYVGLSLAAAINQPLNKVEEASDADSSGRPISATERAARGAAERHHPRAGR